MQKRATAMAVTLMKHAPEMAPRQQDTLDEPVRFCEVVVSKAKKMLFEPSPTCVRHASLFLNSPSVA